MELRETIKIIFSNLDIGKIRMIPNIDPLYPAFVLKTGEEYGVAIKYEGIAVNEKFNSVTMINNKSMKNTIKFSSDDNDDYLLLLCTNVELSDQFSQICTDFVFPDKDGANRKLILNNAIAWWRTWQSLLGNMAVDAKPYSVVSELKIYKSLLEAGVNAIWGGPDSSSHDIMLNDVDIEVKSTLKKYESVVHIAGEYQLEDNGKTLYLCFCRLEPETGGDSIDSLVDDLVQNNDASLAELNAKLKKIGYPEGNSFRREEFVFQDIALYLVDDEFPKITKKNQELWPDAFSKIEYELNLASLPRTKIMEYGEQRNELEDCLVKK